MAVQFRCGACGEEIEVDQELAGQRVTCPFCREEVSAPRESAVAAGVGIDAAPSGMAEGYAEEPAGPPMYLPPRGNTWSWISLACLVGAGICIGVASVGFRAIQKKVDQEFNPSPANPGSVDPSMSAEKRDKMVRDEVQRQVKRRRDLQAMSLLSFCGFPVFGIVAGIIGLTRRRRPIWPAVVTLSVFGICVLGSCLLFILAMAVSPKRGA